jgi:succinyl-CoA synthetase beta subunit
MINIFGGITRCDDVALGIVEALEQLKTNIPVVVRLSGTNAKKGLEIIHKAKLPVVESMSEAAQEAIKMCNERK